MQGCCSSLIPTTMPTQSRTVETVHHNLVENGSAHKTANGLSLCDGPIKTERAGCLFTAHTDYTYISRMYTECIYSAQSIIIIIK